MSAEAESLGMRDFEHLGVPLQKRLPHELFYGAIEAITVLQQRSTLSRLVRELTQRASLGSHIHQGS